MYQRTDSGYNRPMPLDTFCNGVLPFHRGIET